MVTFHRTDSVTCQTDTDFKCMYSEKTFLNKVNIVDANKNIHGVAKLNAIQLQMLNTHTKTRKAQCIVQI